MRDEAREEVLGEDESKGRGPELGARDTSGQTGGCRQVLAAGRLQRGEQAGSQTFRSSR